LGKVLSFGILEFHGEKISYSYCRGEELPNGDGYNNYIETYYGGRICIDDHGFGLDHAINLLKNEISIRKSNQKGLRPGR
jgi:hypothetical protein